MSLIHFSHANGFPADCYQHLFQYLSSHSISYVPILGTGNHRIHYSWRPLSRQIIEDIERKHSEPVVGIGHSMGAVAVFWAAMERPDLFRQIIMMDPPLFGWRTRSMMLITRLLGIQDRLIPIIRNARKRRDHFDSREEALAFFQPKFLFRHFTATSLQDYVNHGLRPADGGGVELTIPKADEARFFSSSPVRIGSTKLLVPSHFLYASKGVLRSSALIEEHKRTFKRTTFVQVEGGHMFPMEKPEETADLINRLIEELDQSGVE